MNESLSNPPLKSMLPPGALWEATTKRTKMARECGALRSIETEYHLIHQNGIEFIVRTLSNLARKEKARQKQIRQESHSSKPVDPFLPYEPDLFVGDISPTHLCLLNKFNVVDNHLLIVTRDFEEQTNLLNLEDFKALRYCLNEIDGLAFFNGGKVAGASQRHKHLQIIPLPLLPGVLHLPLDAEIPKVSLINSVGRIKSFPFRHALGILEFDPAIETVAAAQTMQQHYHSLLNYLNYSVDASTIQQPTAYNLLATRNWMLIVPRSQEAFNNISVNSLGFAGSLFVRDQPTLELLKELTPLKILTEVAIPENQY